MADAEKTLKVLREAAILLRATHGRRGMIVHLDEPGDVVVAGDLHGDVGNFRALLKRANLEREPTRHLVLQEFVHGAERYPNGGCMSHQVLELACVLKMRYPHRVHLLLGNHEFAEWTGRSICKEGVQLNELFASGVAYVYRTKADAILDAYRQVYGAMPLAVRTASRIFVSHSIPSSRSLESFDMKLFVRATVEKSELSKGSSLYHLLWDRDTSSAAASRFAEMVDCDWLVTGHIACTEGFRIANDRQLIVDCSGQPASFVRFSTCRPTTLRQLVAGVTLFGPG